MHGCNVSNHSIGSNHRNGHCYHCNGHIAYHRNADVAITVLMDPITVMVVIHAPLMYIKTHDSHLVFTLITP